MKKIKKIIIFLVFLALLISAASAATVVSIQDTSANVGASIKVPIRIDNVNNISGADIWLSYDKNVVNLESVTKGELGDLSAFNIDNASGITKMNWFSAAGKTGNFVFAYVTLKAVGNAGQTSVLNMTVKELVDNNGMPIVHAVKGGKFTVISVFDPADTDNNRAIDMAELLTAIGWWKSGKPGYGMTELLTTIGRWKAGGY